MSKIQQVLIDVTGVKEKRGEARPAFLDAMLVAVHKLSDADWGKLTKEAQEWFNDATDIKNANIKNPKAAKPIPDFPDATPAAAEDEPKPRRRSAEAAAEPKPELNEEPVVGDVVAVTTKRGKLYEGEVIEVSDTDIVVKVGEEELEFSRDGLTIMVTQPINETQQDDGPAEPKEPEAGDTVVLVTSRGKEYTGEVVEISEDDIVLKVGEEELEFSRSKLTSVVVQGGEEPADDEPKPRGRAAAAAADDEPKPRRGAAASTPPADDAKPKRSSNPRGVSVGGRIREIMADDIAITQDEVGKILKKEGLEFRDTSLGMIYKDLAQFIALLKTAKKLK